MRSKTSFILTAAVLYGLATTSFSLAAAQKHETRFSVRFAGVEIGVAKFDIRFDNSSYALKGTGHTTGLVSWITDASGSVESHGALVGETIKPQTHKAAIQEKSKKQESLVLAFAGDRVADIQFDTIKPRKKRIPPRYVPLKSSHMAAVLDPVSSLILPMSGKDARQGNKVCNRTLPIFDGETRYDITLSYKSTKPVKTDGYNGYAYVCRLKYVPIAGHKKDQRTVAEMARNKNMEIWLAPMQGVSVFSPIRIRVGTKYGTFDAVPRYFGSG